MQRLKQLNDRNVWNSFFIDYLMEIYAFTNDFFFITDQQLYINTKKRVTASITRKYLLTMYKLNANYF